MRPSAKLLLATALAGASPSYASTPLPEYPSLDEKELGQVRNIIALADQQGFDQMQPGPRGAFDQYQFQLAWMYYALAVAQTQQTPAYRELYQRASNHLIQKMMQPEVWNFWLTVVENPRFAKYLDQAKDWRDPVREKNIMYSGHLLQMIGLYQRVYGDKKYAAAGSIKFEIAGKGGFRHLYDFGSLARSIRQQFVESELQGIECEPNFIFAECNQHPVLGLIDYDKIYGTNLADIRAGFWDTAEKLGFLNKQTSRFAGPYLKQERITGKMAVAWNDGWTGITLHAWNPDAVRSRYPLQRDAELPALIGQDPQVWATRWSKGSVSTDFGFLAAYAAELGDAQTVRSLIDYADAKFHPVFMDGRYYYPRRDVSTDAAAVQITGQESVGPFASAPSAPLKPEQFGDHLVGPLTGNALLAFARLNPGNGLWNLYNNLEATFRPGDPQLVDVAYPQVQVVQAYYDPKIKRLAIGLRSESGNDAQANFAIRNLDRSGSYVVRVDGKMVAQGRAGALGSSDSSVILRWNSRGTLELTMPLGAAREIVIDQVEKPLND